MSNREMSKMSPRFMGGRCIFIVGLATAAACGGGGAAADANPPPSMNPQEASEHATATFDSVATLETLMGSPAGEESLGAVLDLYGSLADFVDVRRGEVSGPMSADKAADDSCYIAGSDSVTYNHCVFGTLTIDGTMSVRNGELKIDVTMSSVESSTQVTVTLTADIHFSDTFTKGDFAMDFHGTQGDGVLDYHLAARFDVIQESGCAIGGSLTVTASGTLTGPEHQTQDEVITAEFGPRCGDVTIH